MKEYVCGFLFSPDYSKVVLIKKNRPEWQKGMFNGIGGKIEDGETTFEAMEREFREETYFDITKKELQEAWVKNKDTWKQFCAISGADWIVWFFKTTDERYKNIKARTDETIHVFDTNNLPDHPEYKVIDNLKWLIPMAMDNCHVFAEASARN